MQLLNLEHITRYFGAKLILDDVSLLMNSGDRVGLVGENGAGKTTLARIALGSLDADAGTVSLPDRVGYLPQEAPVDDDLTVQIYLERAIGQLDRMRVQLATLEEAMSHADRDSLGALMEDYGALQEEFTRLGGYDLDYRLDQVLAGLGLTHIDRTRSLRTLSGGEKTRVVLATLLLSAPDLLILDEPTNHLDFAAIDWLESYLDDYHGAVLIISHDRRFLNRTATQIAEIADHQLTVYHGNYEAFIAERERRRAKQLDAYEEQQEEIKALRSLIKAKTHNVHVPPPKDNDKMGYDGHGAYKEKAISRDIKAARQRLEELTDNAVARPVNRWQIAPNFTPEAFASRDVIRFVEIDKSFGDRLLFHDFSAILHGGDRVVIVGPNGVGKTTLLKLILGLEALDSGEIRIAAGARIGYLDQEQETLDPSRTVLEEYSRDLVGTESELRAELHKYGLFRAEQVLQKIGDLSVGQHRKLQIARLIAQKANVLLLDEPTNHLDLESVEQFEQALRDFPGTILATSHDRLFIDRVATVVWTMAETGVVIQG